MVTLDYSTVVQQAAWVASGKVTARQLVEHSLARIDALDHVINAFAVVLRVDALRQADALDAERAAGTIRGPLHGVPMCIKDENDVQGLVTAYGGGAFTTPADADSEVVARLRAAGAIIIGKTRMPEFGLWPFAETEAHGWTRNPWNITRSTGGSSGGTAAAVAAGMVAAGIGGDGGGSIRLPSSWCGLYGLKPQRGRVSTAPHPDLWRALGAIGPLTRTVADSALIYDVLAGTTPCDRFTALPLAGSLADAAASEPGPLRIVVTTKNPGGGRRLDAATKQAIDATAAALAELGHTVVTKAPRFPTLTLPFLSQVAGGVTDEVRRVEHPWALERRTRLAVRLTGALASRAAWGERKAERIATRFLGRLFADADLLVMPTTATVAPRVGQLSGLGGLRAMVKATPVAAYTSPWNVLGNPAATVPVGFDADGMPTAVQIVGPEAAEELIVALSGQLERRFRGEGRRPRLEGFALA